MCAMKGHTRPPLVIRLERASDVDAIGQVTQAAFKNHPISRQTEHYIVDALRASSALSISLVAERDGQVVGHAAFSPVNISDGAKDWYGIGPLSVLPTYQRQGVGKALMNEGLRLLKEMGASGCVLVGDPGYYERFGFRSVPELAHEGVPQENVLALHLRNHRPTGTVTFHPAFMAGLEVSD